MSDQQNVEQSSPLTHKQIKTGLTNVLTGILGAVDKEAKNSILYAELLKNPEIFKNPDAFFFSVTYDQRNATKAALKTIKELNNDNSEEYCHIFLNFKFYTAHIERLITDYSGSFGCADISGTILGRYLVYLRTGDKGKWEIEEEHCYWLPKFGSQDDWYELMTGLHYLYYGQTVRYLTIYQKLIQQGTEYREKRKAEYEASKAQNLAQ